VKQCTTGKYRSQQTCLTIVIEIFVFEYIFTVFRLLIIEFQNGFQGYFPKELPSVSSETAAAVTNITNT